MESEVKVCSISNKYHLPIKSAKNIVAQGNLNPFQKKLSATHRTVFQKVFYSIFTTFSLFLAKSEVCKISNKYRISYKPVKKIFLHKATYIPSILKKFGTPHRRVFQKHPLFYHIFTILAKSEVCNIPSKYHLRNKSAKYYFYTRELRLLHQRNIQISPHSFCFNNNGVRYFQLPNKSAKY